MLGSILLLELAVGLHIVQPDLWKDRYHPKLGSAGRGISLINGEGVGLQPQPGGPRRRADHPLVNGTGTTTRRE